MHNNIFHIKNGRIIDPANNRDEVGNLFIKGGKICYGLSEGDKKQAKVIDVRGDVVAPGLVDVHVHFREPGQTHKETIETGSLAALAGGVTTVVTMPNTSPACDNRGTIEWIKRVGEEVDLINIFSTGTLSVLRQGKAMAPLAGLKSAGVVAITDDGDCIQDNLLMRRICEYAAMLDLPIMDHCQDMSLTPKAVVNEGMMSLKLGVGGWPSVAEDVIVSRNIILSKLTGAHIHMQHLSSAYSVELMRRAKKDGIRVTAEVTPHHLALTEDELVSFDTNFKMNPPLRTEEDRQALIAGVLDGTIDIIATDHAPHSVLEKDNTLENAPFGIIGLQTLLPICLDVLYRSGKMNLLELLSKLTYLPAQLLKLDKGTLSEDADADIAIFNLEDRWVFDGDSNRSKSSNSPWFGKELKGSVKYTFVKGRLLYEEKY